MYSTEKYGGSHYGSQRPLDLEEEAQIAEQDMPPQYSESVQSDEKIGAEVEKDLAWIRRSRERPQQAPHGRLPGPVAIPATAPGISSQFSRAWAPVLEQRDIRQSEFLEFLDHLNVCKAASPPMQVVSLAGNILGFTPIPYATLIGIGVQAGAAAGNYAVAKVRIARYLERANNEYFKPRGLYVRVAKDAIVQQAVGLPSNAPLLAPAPRITPDMDPASIPSARNRRMQALQGYVAPLQFENLAPLSIQSNAIDKISSKMSAFKNRKGGGDKLAKEVNKESKKMREEQAKIQKDIDKVNREAQEELADHPEDAAKIEKDRQKELRKLQKDLAKADGDFQEKVTDESEKAEKGNLLWVLIEDVQGQQDGSSGQAEQASRYSNVLS